MLDFEFDPGTTGGSIDNWYVNTESSSKRTPLILLYSESNLNAPVELEEITLGIDSDQDHLDRLDINLIDQKCDERMALLAKRYAESVHSKFLREFQARIQILENELDILMPRYTESDWELLDQFKRSIDVLNRT